MSDDAIDLKEVKRLLKLILSPPKPPQHIIRKAVKNFKYVVWAWWIFTLVIAIGLRVDFHNNPELWYFVEGIEGEQLLADEEAARPQFFNEKPFQPGSTFQPTNRYPDWVYQTSKFKTLEHFTGLILGRVGLWFMFTFLMLAAKLRLTTWQLEYAREKIKEVVNVKSEV